MANYGNKLDQNSKSVVRKDVGVQVSPPAPMMPGFEGKGDRDARRESSVCPARANSGVSRAVLPAASGKRSGEGVPPAAGFGRLALPLARPADAIAIIDRPAICPPMRVREPRQRRKRLSKDCLGRGRTTKSRSTYSSRRRASRDRWSSSTLVALWSNISLFGMIVLHVEDTLASARCPINDAGGSKGV